jgi:small subunit ribosomal protein S18
MPQRREKKSPSAKDRRPIKKKMSILNSENIQWIDYKDVNLLRRFMSERAKIRARRVTGNDQQQQAAVAKAIKLAREMALLPYSVRQVTQRSKGRRDRGDRGDRGELRLPSSAPSSPSPSASEDFGDEAVLDALETEFDAPEAIDTDLGDVNGDGGADSGESASEPEADAS